MRNVKYILFTLFVCMATGMEAKPQKEAHIYLFGFSASFKDSVVYMTDIQDVQGAWTDDKTAFLLGRDNYSYQLKDYLTQQLQLSDRVCMVFFAKNKKKAEKLYLKIRKKYTAPARKSKKGDAPTASPYDIRYINQQDFKFEPIDMSPEQ